MVVGLLRDADGLLQGQVCLVAEEEQTAVLSASAAAGTRAEPELTSVRSGSAGWPG